MTPLHLKSAILGALGLASEVAAVNNGLARTPQMGWNTWNTFACDVSEELMLTVANSMVDLGLRDAGYTYANLDDCWSLHYRNPENNSLIPDPEKFPNGIAFLANEIHDLGLLFGIYGTAGSLTCGRYPASLGYEEVDAQTWANWGIDYLKYDNCFNEGQSGTPLITYNRYKVMSDALNATGRPILYSMCNWGEDYPWKWAQTVANSWRMSGDITDRFDAPDPRCPCTGDEGYDCALPGFHCSAMNILNKMSSYPDKGIPGAWNDLDMLEVGRGGMTDDEYKLHFTMWAAVKSPLIMGNDIRNMTPETYSILTNPAILALSQDPQGSSVVRRWRYPVNDTNEYGQGEIQMWSGDLYGNDKVVILVNAGNSSRVMNTTIEEVYWDQWPEAPSGSVFDMYDLWANRMPNEIAAQILDNNSTAAAANATQYYYNATHTPFAEGIAANNTLLMGVRVGTLAPFDTLSVEVPRHGVVAYRLKEQHMGLRERDEL